MLHPSSSALSKHERASEGHRRWEYSHGKFTFTAHAYITYARSTPFTRLEPRKRRRDAVTDIALAFEGSGASHMTSALRWEGVICVLSNVDLSEAGSKA